MRSVYSRIQRASIYHPATIGDIPQEVLREAFIYLLPGESDLLASSEACRAWRPVAQELMYSRQIVGERSDIVLFVCGFHLKSLVLGRENVSINRLELKIEYARKENIHLLARLVAPSLTSLHLDFMSDDEPSFRSSYCYATLEVFFLHCRGTRNLSLIGFDFGIDPDSISPRIKEEFSRLANLKLTHCDGDSRMFVEAAPIPDLRNLRIVSYYDSEIVVAMAMNYRSLTSIYLHVRSVSSATISAILQVVKYCRDLNFFFLKKKRYRRGRDIGAFRN
jgi:hypothetical protein